MSIPRAFSASMAAKNQTIGRAERRGGPATNQVMFPNDNSANFRLSPTKQKSQHTSSGITSQINAKSSPDDEDAFEPDGDTQQEVRSGTAGDLTQELVYSQRTSPIQAVKVIDPTASDGARNFRSFLQAAELEAADVQSLELGPRKEEALENIEMSGSEDYGDDEERSFENDNDDSVGEEFSLLINGVEMIPDSQPCHQQSLKKNSGQHFNNGKLKTRLGGQDRAKAKMKSRHSGAARDAVPGERQKVKVRGSVVRNNFQQSMQAINFPLRQNSDAITTANIKQPYLMKLPRSSNLPPQPPKPANSGRRSSATANVEGKTMMQAMAQQVNHSLFAHETPMIYKRPLSATQSLSNRFKNGVPVKQHHHQQMNRKKYEEGKQFGSFVDPMIGVVAMGPKISGEKFVTNSEGTSKHAGKVLERSMSPSDDSNGLPQVMELKYKETYKNSAFVATSQYGITKPMMNSRPQKPLDENSIQKRQPTLDSLGSCSLERCDDSHNISASQLTKLQTIKTISKQSIRAARFDDKRRHEVNKIIQAMPNAGDHSFNFIASEQTAQDLASFGVKGAVNRRHHLDPNPQLKELHMPQMNLKFVSLNLFSKNLLSVDLSENKIKSLPEEVAMITTLQTLKIDGNQIEALPKDLWKLQKLKQIIAYNNQIRVLPPNFEWLPSLECLAINDNLLTKLPEKIGLLSTLQKLHLHENRLASLPRELSKLVNLIDFSLEWFMYTKPANARMQKNPEVIKSVRDFCSNFHFNPGQARIGGGTLSSHGFNRNHQISIQSECYQAEQPNQKANATQASGNNKYVTFSDFIIQYHKIAHSDLAQINKIEYTMKKRSLIHQICFNVHSHLLRSLLDMPLAQQSLEQRSETSPDVIDKPKVEKSLQGMNNSQDQIKVVISEAENLTMSPPIAETSECAVAKVINLNKKDTQGVVPLCLLVMNMTPNERKPEMKRDISLRSPRSGEKDMAKAAANFFSQDHSLIKSIMMNKKRKAMIRLLLECRDEKGDALVDINNNLKRNLGKSQASTILMGKTKDQHELKQPGTQQQHPVLYWTVFKYQFKLAIELIENYDADPTVLNSNNSNLLHILFANFNNDMVNATRLAVLLIARKVNLNLMDKDGKSPVLVAIKKSQIEALQFAHKHNIYRQSALQQDPSFAKASQLIRKSVSRLELFDFRMRGRSRTTPLHYVIKKSNYESFMYLIVNKLSDCLARDSDAQTPRLTSLINSAFYRVLLKEERRYVREQIASHELLLVQKKHFSAHATGGQQNKIERSLLCHMLSQTGVIIDERLKEIVPPLKVFPNMESQDKHAIEMMRKTASDSVPTIMETNSAFGLSQRLDSATAKISLRQQQQTNLTYLSQRGQIGTEYLMSAPLSAVASQHRMAANEADLGSLVSPKLMMFRAPPVQRISLRKMHQEVKLAEAHSLKGSQANKVSSSHVKLELSANKKSHNYHKAEPSEAWFLSSQLDTVIDPETRVFMDAAAQFDRMNFVQHCVISMRSIYRAEDFVIETTLENYHHEEIYIDKQRPETLGIEVQAKRPNRSSTMRLGEKELMDFTLGRNKNSQKAAQQFAVQRIRLSSNSSERVDSVLSMKSHSKVTKAGKDHHLYSPTQVPPTIQSSASAFKVPHPNEMEVLDEEQTTELFQNADDAVTARVLNLDSERTFHQQKQMIEGQSAVSNTKFKQFNMFRSMKNRTQMSPSTVTDEASSSLPAQMRLYEQRAIEMRPLQLKRPNIESPQQMMRRQDSDISIPPSLPVGDETQHHHNKGLSIDSRFNLHHESLLSTKTRDQKVALDDELGQTINCLLEDEVLQETMPKKINDDQVQQQDENNLFGYVQRTANLEEIEPYETERVLEGPLIQPISLSQRDQQSKVVLGETQPIKISQELDMTSPHFNQDGFQFADESDPNRRDSSSVQRFDQEGDRALAGSKNTASEVSHGYALSNRQGIQKKPYEPESQQVLRGRGLNIDSPVDDSAAPSQIEQQAMSPSNIFISNMNININLNININMPQQDRATLSSRNSEFSDRQTGLLSGMGSKQQQTNHDHQHLSTILDEQLMGEIQHRPKPSLGSKFPPNNPSNCVPPENAIGSITESQAKKITQKQILDQINPKELVQAVSQHFQMQTQSQRDMAVEGNQGIKQLTEMNQRKGSMPQLADEQRMFLSSKTQASAQLNVPMERKRFHAGQAFLNRQNKSNSKESQRSNGRLNTASENLDTSVLGMTPAKPEFEQSALKDKQNHRVHLGGLLLGDCPIQSRELLFEKHNVPYSYRKERNIAENNSPKFRDGPENKEELFAGRAPAQGQHIGDMGNLLGESDEKLKKQKIFGYMLTDTPQCLTQKKNYNEVIDQQPLQSDAKITNSQMLSCTSRMNGEPESGPNKYTLGNVKRDDQQLTIPSLTQQSQFVMNTGVSDLGGQSPINIPLLLSMKCGTPVGVDQGRVGGLLRRASLNQANQDCVVQNSGESNRLSLPLKPVTAHSELLERCETQLKQNTFLKEFRIIVDPFEPDWVKYQVLYKQLARFILVNPSKTASKENGEQREALRCLELLIEVLTLQPNGAILPDLIHLMTKGNLMKARNDIIDQVNTALTIQRDQLLSKKNNASELTTLKRAGVFAINDVAAFATFSLSMAFMEAQNAKSIHEVYKKIQLNKFPTISKNLGLFLKNKRETKKSNDKKSKMPSRREEETQRTQNIPQSLQKRVKISMVAKPQVLEEPLNEAVMVFTPSDFVTSKMPPPAMLIQPSPNQSIPRHPTKLASQMKQLNASSMASRPGIYSKLKTRMNKSTSNDTVGINISRELPSQIQPIRTIMSPKGFFPSNP